MMFGTVPAVYVFAWFAVFAAARMIAGWQLEELLKRRHPNEWKNMAAKTSRPEDTDREDRSFFNFVVFGGHKTVNDKYVSFLCHVIVFSTVAAVAGALYGMVTYGKTRLN